MKHFCLPAVLMIGLGLGVLACSGSSNDGDLDVGELTSPVYRPVDPLTVAEVNTIIMQAVDALDHPDLVVAVVDRIGNILGGYSNASPSNSDNDDLAVSIARSSAFFSNAQAPLT